MRRACRALQVVALMLAVAQPTAARDQGLTNRLEQALRVPALRGARVGVLVVSREDGRVLFERTPDRALVPASNMKILTSIAALSTWGPTHRFTTEVFSDALPDAEGGVGTLYVRGGGDPALTSEDYWRLAADLRRRGVRLVRGDLVLDDSLFDRERWHPSWGAVSQRAYHAPVSALAANYGAFGVAVEPGTAPGDPVRAVVDPPVAFLPLVNRAVTGPARGRTTLVVERNGSGTGGREQVSLSGEIRAGAELKTWYRSVGDPTGYAGSVLLMQLEANGIEVRGGVRQGAAPDGAPGVLSFEGKQLSQVVQRFMKYSNNSIGETLVKNLAARAGERPASWQGGVAAMKVALGSVGVRTDELRLVDGSGLSYANRVTPRSLVDALRRADDSFLFGPEFEASLPIAFADGTLEERAEGAANHVRAKTGLLTRVTALSGYAALADGSGAVFSVIANGYRSGAGSAMDALDGFVAALVSAP